MTTEMLKQINADAEKQYASNLQTPILQSVSNVATGVRVTWNQVTGASGYRVFCKTASTGRKRIATINGTSYIDSTVTSGTNYYYTVRAYQGSYSNAERNVYQANFLSSYDKVGEKVLYLTMPNVSVANRATGVKVSWKQIIGASGYYVYRKTTNTGWKRIATTSNSIYIDIQASSGMTYYYTVRAYNGNTMSTYVSSNALKYLEMPAIDMDSLEETFLKKYSRKKHFGRKYFRPS